MIDCDPPRLAAKIAQAAAQRATFIVIDTPPHADSAASKAVEAADLVLIPCRPSAFDLAAIRTTGQLIKLHGKPAALVFTAGPPSAPKTYADATTLVESFASASAPTSSPTAPPSATPALLAKPSSSTIPHRAPRKKSPGFTCGYVNR